MSSSGNGGSTSTPEVDSAITGGKKWKPFITMLNDTQLKEVEDRISLNEFTIDVDGTPKLFTRRKIKTKDYAVLELIRAKYAASPPGLERSQLNIEQYQKSALFYLGMTQDEAENCDFEELKRIIDAQNVRTNYGVPNPTTS